MKLEDLIAQSNGKENFPVICPFHVSKRYDGTLGPEAFGSCFLHTSKQVFYCFGCGAKGSFIKLKSLLEGTSYSQAKWELYKGEIPDHVIHAYLSEEVEDPIYFDSFLAPYKPLGAVPERGISEKGSQHYRLLTNDKRDIVIPYYRREDESLVGAQIRKNTVEDDTNWYDQLLHFRRGQWLFGEQLLKEQNTVVCCEGALDAVKLYDCLGIMAVAMNGSIVTDAQVRTISNSPINHVTIWPDNDQVGRLAAVKNYHKLKRIVAGEVHIVKYEEGDRKDPCEMSEERIKELWKMKLWGPVYLLQAQQGD